MDIFSYCHAESEASGIRRELRFFATLRSVQNDIRIIVLEPWF
jgi:hypothetical protein